jgi:EAL domain-containing protein (putative c-di-GMP-specific phosphodiesterase class I)
MHERAVKRLQLETDLRHAIERNEFVLHYQPLVDMSNDQIMGFEALIRWNHPQRGLLGPGEFLTVAEETGLIIPIGYWVLEEACSQLSQWNADFRRAKPLAVSVNLSCKQFVDTSLVEKIDEILARTGMDSTCLWLEVTESVVMENSAMAIAMLKELKQRGIQVCLDDFGTGHSTLSYLHRLPIDTLKIDRSFVSEIDGKGDGAEIVKTIMTLAHHLGLDVVAEGIESQTQLSQVKALNGQIGQGFFFARPMASQAVEAMWNVEPGRFGTQVTVN